MVLIYSENINSRLIYTLKVIFGEVLNYPYLLTDDYTLFTQSNAKRLNYSNKKISKIAQITPSGLLEEKGIHEQTVNTGIWEDIPVLFLNNDKEIPFDLLSAIFYLVTRYEEYLPFQPDRHGRFEAAQSIAWKNNFLHLPVVDLWCMHLAAKLGIEKECAGVLPEKYRFQLTVDIDQAWTFNHKGLLLSTGTLFKSLLQLDFSKFILQTQILFQLVKDPADTYDFLSETGKKLSEGIKYFILFGRRGRYDHNISTENKNFHSLIHTLEEKNKIGIHPSYASNASFSILEREYKKLSGIVNKEVKMSRQHFLKLNLPDTYRNLLKLAIEEDYSMGYGSQTGFRAGIARPFDFYDLSEEKHTKLRIFPFQVMDRTLLTYLKYSPEKAISEFTYYSGTIRAVGGQFVALWHNTSLGDQGEWKGWKGVFEQMVYLNRRTYSHQ
jgi:hypothetical protein